MNYQIKHVTNEYQLDATLEFARKVFGGLQKNADYSREAWRSRIEKFGEWLLYAEYHGEIIGMVFGRVDGGNSVTVGPVATDERYRDCGIATALIAELEKRVVTRGFHQLWLGSVEGAEGFYLKCGFTPFLLVQCQQLYTLDDLRRLNTGHPEAWSYDDGVDRRLCLLTKSVDKELQYAYEREFPGCSAQMLMSKQL